MPLGLNRMASHWDAFFWIHICMHTFFSIFNLMISQSDRMVKLGMYIRNGGQCWQTSGSWFLEKITVLIITNLGALALHYSHQFPQIMTNSITKIKIGIKSSEQTWISHISQFAGSAIVAREPVCRTMFWEGKAYLQMKINKCLLSEFSKFQVQIQNETPYTSSYPLC